MLGEPWGGEPASFSFEHRLFFLLIENPKSERTVEAGREIEVQRRRWHFVHFSSLHWISAGFWYSSQMATFSLLYFWVIRSRKWREKYPLPLIHFSSGKEWKSGQKKSCFLSKTTCFLQDLSQSCWVKKCLQQYWYQFAHMQKTA